MESAGPDPPALRESAWSRAKADANRVYRSPLFGIALALVGLMATSIGVLFTVGSTVSTGTQVAVPLLSGTAAIAITFLIVLVLQTASAPVRQRNELRQSWPVGPIHEPPNVELTLRNYVRRGEAVQDRVDGASTRDDRRAAEDWAEEVVQFLMAHGPPDAARAFLTATEDGRPSYRVDAQLKRLREIAEAVS